MSPSVECAWAAPAPAGMGSRSMLSKGIPDGSASELSNVTLVVETDAVPET